MAERKADMTVKDFIRHNYRHFNAAVVVDASEAYIKHLASGGEMVMTICRAMRTAEIRLSLAETISRGQGQGTSYNAAESEGKNFKIVSPQPPQTGSRPPHLWR